MKLTVQWRDRAIREAQEAFDWYEERSAGTGVRLLAELDTHIELLKERPTAFPKWRLKYRKARLKHFPYLLIYRHENRTIVILSFFHSKRDPKHLEGLR